MGVRINSSGGHVQLAALDDSDAGEGLAIFFSQPGNSVCRYRFLVKAKVDGGDFDVGEFYSSPPGATAIPGRPSRMIAGAICPGATGWSVYVSAVPVDDEIAPETANVSLASSHAFAQMGVTRVAERYSYEAFAGTANFTVLAGMRITGIAAVGLTGGGTIVVAGGDTVTVPEGISANLEPGSPIAPNSVIAFTNVDWVIEYLESA